VFLVKCQVAKLQTKDSGGIFLSAHFCVWTVNCICEVFFFFKCVSGKWVNKVGLQTCIHFMIIFFFKLKFNFSLPRNLCNSSEVLYFYCLSVSCKGLGLSFDRRGMVPLNINNVLVSR
jgi:hypothetical protein